MQRLVPVALAAALLVPPAPALAAGTGGIEVTPVSETGATTFDVEVPREGTVSVPFLLRNVEDQPRSGRIYAARVTQTDGNFALDRPGSSPYVALADREVTLQPGEVREEAFEVSAGPDGVPDGQAFAAVVVEVRNGSVVQRANTLVYLRGERQLPLPLLLVVAAVALVLLAGGAVAAVARRRAARSS